MRNGQSVNLIDSVKVKQFVQDLFYPKPTPKGSSSATPTPTPTPTKLNYATLANGKSVDGSKIPCVN